MPTYFIPHGGGPCFFMDWSITGDPADTWNATAAWLRAMALELPARPSAILVISAHWEEPGFTISSADRPGMIFDYYGFPEDTYRLRYPAPGSPALAAEAAGLLREAGLPARQDEERGFDHGVFVPFLLAFPDAAIPVVPLSLHRQLDPQLHLSAGRSLRALRDRGVLIIGSGMSYHNMRGFRTAEGAGHSETFDRWLTAAVQAAPGQRWQELLHWADAPAARACHPREEHLLPLMVAAGAAADAPGRRVFTDTVMGTRISAYRFG